MTQLFAATEALEPRTLFVAADPSFGSGGVITRFVKGNDEVAEHAVALDYGQVLVQGRTFDGGAFENAGTTIFAVYTPAGKLATGFNGNGKLVLSASVNHAVGIVSDVRKLGDGSVLIVGDNGLAKLKTNGKLDAGFGQNGVAAVPQYGDREYDDSTEAAVTANGFKVGSYSPSTGVLAVATYDAHGKLTDAARRTIQTGGGQIFVTPNAETIAFPNGKVRQFRTSLQVESNFAAGGVLDLKPLFDAFAKTKKPWTNLYGNDYDGLPPFSLDRFESPEASRRGFIVYGKADGRTKAGGLPWTVDHGEYETPLTIDISTDGKSVKFYGANASGAIYGRTHFVSTPSGSFNFQHFGGTFYTATNHVETYEDEKFTGVNDEYAADAVPAGGNKYYVFGAINQYSPGDNRYHFAVVRTNAFV